MIGVDADVLCADGTTIKAGNVKGGGVIADWDGKPQMAKTRSFTKEKEFTIVELENGKALYCLPYLSILTWDDEIDARFLESGDKVLGFRNGEKCEIEVTRVTRVTTVTKRRLDVPKKVKMVFFETYEDKPFVANEVCIGMRKQITKNREARKSIKEFIKDYNEGTLMEIKKK